ncbi:MAG: hypothetical protein KDB61_05405 [Planctomycetes bacterium]|nr:hypothetical protein [Planctomycetota bacterium]
MGVGLLFHLLLLAVLCMYYQELNRGLGFIEWLKAIFGKLIWQATPGFVVGALIGAFIGHIQDPGSPRSRGK